MKLNKIAMGVAAAGMAIGFSLPAQADVLAQSVLELTNFRFTNVAGAILDASQFDTLIFSDSSDISVTLNGTTITDSQGPVDGFGGINGIHQVLGGPNPGPDNYAHVFAPASDRARGDTLLAGAPITGTGFASGANAHTLAEAQLINGGSGSAEDNLGLLATLSFSTRESQAVGVAFDADVFLKAFVTAGSQLGSAAQARSSWSISLADADGNTLFDWTPDGILNASITGATEGADDCDLTRTLGAQIPGQNATHSCVGDASATTNFVLDAGQSYTLTIAHESTADANSIPEPATLALLGFGLLGMGAVARKRKA